MSLPYEVVTTRGAKLTAPDGAITRLAPLLLYAGRSARMRHAVEGRANKSATEKGLYCEIPLLTRVASTVQTLSATPLRGLPEGPALPRRTHYGARQERCRVAPASQVLCDLQR